MSNTKTYTIMQAALKVGKHPNTIRRWVKDGMPAKKEFGKVIIAESDLIEWYEKMRDR